MVSSTNYSMNEKIKEFIELGYSSKSLGCLEADIPINDMTLLRVKDDRYNILFLNNGNTISFDSSWITFFRQLGEYYRHLEDSVFEDKFVSLMLKAAVLSRIQVNNDWLNCILEACNIGTSEFRENYPELGFKPFEYKQLLDTLEV